MWVQWVLPELSAHLPVAISSDGKIKPGDARNVPIQMIFCMKVSQAGEGMLIARNATRKRRVQPVGVYTLTSRSTVIDGSLSRQSGGDLN